MALNEYDALLDNQTKEQLGGNPYSETVATLDRNQKIAVRASLGTAAETQPDRHAEVMKLSDKYKLAPDLVDRNFDTLSRRSKSDAVDPDRLVNDYRGLAEWLSDPNNASLVADDIPQAQKLSETIKEYGAMESMYRGMMSGFSTATSGIAKIPALAYDLAAAPQNALMKAIGKDSWQVQAPDWLRNNPVAEQADKQARGLSDSLPEMNASVIEQLGKGDIGKASRTLAVQFFANLPQQAMTIGMTAAGMPIAGVGLAGATTAADVQARNAEQGMDPTRSIVNAVTQGTAEALFERLGTIPLLKKWEAAISSQYGKDMSKRVMQDMAKTLAASFAQEGAEEMATQAVQDASDVVTGANPDLTLGESLSNIANAGIIGGVSGGVMTSPAGIAMGAARAHQIKTAQRAVDFHTAIGQTVLDSKLMKRLPKAQQNLVETLTKDGPVENVYMPVEAVESYFQSKKLDPLAAAQSLGFAQELSEAKETGGDVRVPISKFITNLVETEHYQGLAKDIKYAPEAMTLREVEESQKSMRAELKLLEKDAETADQTKPTPLEAMTPEERRVRSARDVKQNVYDQLIAMNNPMIGPKEAKQMSLVHAQSMLSLASRTGQDPMELFNRYGLQIQTTEGMIEIGGQDVSMAAQSEVDQATELFQSNPIYGKFKTPLGIKSATVNILQPESITMDQARDSIAGQGDIEAKLPGGATVIINRETFDKSKYEIGMRGATDEERGAAAVIAKNLPTLVSDLVMEAVERNTKKDKKPHAQDYRRFYGVVEIDGSKYAFQLKTERPVRGSAAKYKHERVYFEFARKLESPSWNAEADSSGALKINQTVRRTSVYPDKAEISIGEFAEKINSVRAKDPYFQSDAADDSPRGRIVIGSNKTMRIDLFAKADLSTFLHETGHFYLEVLADLSKDERASAQLKADYQSVREWLGAKGDEPLTVDQHEQFARGFEMYLARGEAPTKELRTAFANFKVWLTNIYKNLRRLDVELTPEIKNVMDRLMATDEQLAEAVRGQPSLLDNPLAIGMSPEQAEKYKKLENDAKRAANEELTAKVMKHEMQKREAAYKVARSEVMAGIEAQANEMRVFKALAILQRGKMADGSDLPDGVKPIKIDRESIVEMFGKEALDKLPRPYVYAREGGVHVNVAAEMLGYESGDALIKSISEMPSKKEYVERETDREMAVRFPDEIMNSFPEEAVKAAHVDPRRKVLRFELEFLASKHPALLKDAIKRVARRVPSEDDVKAQARRLVANKRIEEIRPYQFQRAEIKAAKEAGVLLANGDISGAFEAKRRELLNYELYRSAVEAQEFVEKSEDLFKKLKQSDEDLAKTRDTDLINVARAILAAHGLGKAEKTPEQYLENMKRYDPENYESAIAIIQNAGLVPGPYREITLDAFTNMSDTVKALWDLSKQARSVEIDGKRVDRDVIKAELVSRIDAVKEPGQRPGYDKAVTEWEKTKMKLLGMRASLRRVESWVSAIDGDGNGVFRKYVWNPISEATAKYRVEKVKVLTQWQDIVKKWAGESDSLSVPIRAENLGYTFAGKAELMAAVLHTGNESNFEKLLLGRGWGERLADGTVDRSRWDAFITKQWRDGVLTKADYDFAQQVWDLNESLKPEAQKAHKKMYGFYFNEVTAHRFETPFGSYRGGYVPAMTDMVMVEDSAIRQEQESLLKQNNSSMFPTTGRGFTKSRVEQYTAPLSLDLRQVGSHLDKVLRFIHIEPKVKEVGRIVMDKSFRASLAEIDPTVGAEMLVPWLQRAAQQNVSTASKGWAGRGLDAFAKELRKRTGLQTMFFNVTNTIQQITGFTIAAVKVQPKYMRTAFAQYLKGPGDFAKDVAAKSQFMETRTATQVMEVNKIIDDISLSPSKFDDFKTFVQEHGYFMQSAAQNLVDLTVWSGAYNQAVEQGLGEIEAVRAADSAVRETQGSMNPEDMSRFEGGSPFVRLFTMFYSYFNMQANLLGTEFVKTTRDLGLKKGAGRLLYIYMMGFMLPAVLSDLLVKAMGSGIDEDDDEQYLDDLLATFFTSQFSTATAMFPVVGPVVKSAVNTLNDKPYDDKLTTSPAVSMIESAVKAPLSVYKAIADGGSKKAAIRDSMSAVGLLTGIPTGPIQKPASYLADVSEGEADPTGPIDFTRGLVTGKPGAAQ